MHGFQHQYFVSKCRLHNTTAQNFYYLVTPKMTKNGQAHKRLVTFVKVRTFYCTTPLII
uniref:Uncharacterized protein n=1 Tax=Anguilla anguilla TaxID=7936 RepID=A0A0E9Y284_ANGAN